MAQLTEGASAAEVHSAMQTRVEQSVVGKSRCRWRGTAEGVSKSDEEVSKGEDRATRGYLH